MWKMEGRFADGEEITVTGPSEEYCVETLYEIGERHGGLEWYTGVTDEDYAFGEYIGRENFIYD